MTEFTEYLANELLLNYGKGISDVCVICPSRRGGLFLQRSLANIVDQPIISPHVTTMTDFMADLSEYHIGSSVSLKFLLYESYLKLNPPNQQEFNEFLSWAGGFLGDINDLDMTLVDANSMFGSVNKARAIEIWNPGREGITETQEKYLKFWSGLLPLYNQFRKDLHSKNIAYSGMAFRKCAEKIKSENQEKSSFYSSYTSFVFVGFNAFSKSEETVVNTLIKNQKGNCYWDPDGYYLDNECQEAGRYLRYYFKKNHCKPQRISKELMEGSKRIVICATNGVVAQCMAAGNLLRSLSPDEMNKTAVVLADESMLIPMVESLPKEVTSANVSMGISVFNYPITSFIRSWIDLHVHSGNFGSDKDFSGPFFYKKFELILNHPGNFILQGQTEIKKCISRYLTEFNRTYIDPKEINELLAGQNMPTDKTDLLFSSFNLSPKILLENITKIFESADLSSDMFNNPSNLESFNAVMDLFRVFKNLQNRYLFSQNLDTFLPVFNQAIRGETITLRGEPLEGLQILGILETRMLNFDRVIVLGLNEGIYPKGKHSDSLIPFDIRQAFGLPGYPENDAIFAFHFYHLLQKAKNIHLFYDANESGFGKGEMSRFILQIVHELSVKNKNISISKEFISMPADVKTSKVLSISSSPEINQKIIDIVNSGLSPSALNTFISCPLDFYYKYILRLREEDEVTPEVEHSHFGSILHYVLEKLYGPFEGKFIAPNDLIKLIGNHQSLIINGFEEMSFSKRSVQYGRNLIAAKVINRQINRFLKFDSEYIEANGGALKLLAVEMKLKAKIVHPSGTTINFKGHADRIDLINNNIRIIDYKSGKVESKELALDSLQAQESDKGHNPKLFQVLMYAWMWKQMQKEDGNRLSENISSGIFSFRNFNNGYLLATGKSGNNLSDELQEFEMKLTEVCSNLLDEQRSFKHNSDSQYCSFCSHD